MPSLRMSPSLEKLLDRLALWRTSPVRGYGFGLAAFAVSLGARLLLAPVMPATGFPFITFFPAVILTALVGGLWPSLLVSLLSTLAADYFFMPLTGTLHLAGPTEVVALGFFVAVLLVDCVVIHTMLTSLRQVREQQAHNAALNEELERRLKELDASRSEIERVSRAKSRMLAIVGHDLRQPLHVVTGAVRLLLQHSESEASTRLLRMTERNILSISRSFEQLVDVVRHESSRSSSAWIPRCPTAWAWGWR